MRSVPIPSYMVYRYLGIEALKATPRVLLSALQIISCLIMLPCRNCESELVALKSDLRTALEAMVQHRMELQQRLEAAATIVKDVHSEMQQLPHLA